MSGRVRAHGEGLLQINRREYERLSKAARPPYATITDLRRFVTFVDLHPEFRSDATPIFCLHLDSKSVPSVGPDGRTDNTSRLQPAFALTALMGLSGIAVVDEAEARILLPHIADISAWIVFIIRQCILPKEAHRRPSVKRSLRPISDVFRPLCAIGAEMDLLGLNLVRPVADLWILAAQRSKINAVCRQGWEYSAINAFWASAIASHDPPLRSFLSALVDSDVPSFVSSALCHLSRTINNMDGKLTSHYDLTNDMDVVYFLSLYGEPTLSDIVQSLLEKGAMTLMSKGAGLLAKAVHSPIHAHHVLAGITKSAGFFTIMSCVAPGRPWVIQAVKNGIIQALVQAAYLIQFVKIETAVEDYVRGVQEALHRLCAYLVYRSVLRVVLKAVETIDESRLFRSDPRMNAVWDLWETFMVLVMERDILYTAAKPRVVVVCKSCGLKDSGDTFMRCSGCVHTWYCSSACQENDWKADHREFCTDFKLRSRLGDLHTLSFRDYEMVKAVTRYDLSRRNDEIKAQLRLPDRFFPPVIELSYMMHPVQLKVMTVAEHAAYRAIDPDNPSYDAALEKVRKGKGLFALARTLLPLGNRWFDANFWAQIVVREAETPEEEEILREVLSW
ncbi:hypothetical protein PUNSTDRAFT_134537 [Punctularia strigosozonata HHB-11173 SS5]|uniref:uncharacterized protein n=1 Tax=Punctularia strigosozonata (strain HHB-11173) TaxID=741275 RepID=UPI0004417D25|nr:uncharacterized protein PUNSTDRAFT_134537 [Punctularia strigosozonata HHB-11173 SS5]EIN08136.1 hypothetical protein PUNSTDRAFT_134537 [Punctularia strigosozonata HHB-11173 SS5]